MHPWHALLTLPHLETDKQSLVCPSVCAYTGYLYKEECRVCADAIGILIQACDIFPLWSEQNLGGDEKQTKWCGLELFKGLWHALLNYRCFFELLQ
jgi:hypothetical protein